MDDSRLAREIVTAILSADRSIRVVGEAENGAQAVEKVRELRPDIVIMDVEMPVMSGIQAIEKIMAYNAVPILVVTSQGGADVAYSAISKGALEVVPKSDLDPDAPEKFNENVKLLAKVRVVTHIGGRNVTLPSRKETGEGVPRVVAIASSTGGPKALSVVLPEIPADFPAPIVVAQHIADGFAEGMVSWLGAISKVRVKVGEDGETLAPATVYIAPSERHMMVTIGDRISLIERKPTDFFRPSCDMLLLSVAATYGVKAIGVILTGMGTDGVQGMRRIKDVGGRTVAQDEASSIIFGMPRVAIEAGCIDSVLPIEKIGPRIVTMVKG